ncbi:MAG: hypothetical protein IMW90_17745 [Thermogemmatispora sp.]|uniref:hypothetical protein n=1 Tax=Thermogemmatispora sp. TaxID=1968838 RepID=UPI0019FDA4AC|nr:hypothetical protein [Thermogemmatispora sp.]MBE3567561.1 hypothetical protein [Thermogemmatispora sp.]
MRGGEPGGDGTVERDLAPSPAGVGITGISSPPLSGPGEEQRAAIGGGMLGVVSGRQVNGHPRTAPSMPPVAAE